MECVRVTAQQLLDMTEEDLSLPEEHRAEAGLSAYLDFVEHRAAAYVALMRSGIGNDPEVALVLDDTRAEFVRRMLEGMGITEPRPVFRMAARCWIPSIPRSLTRSRSTGGGNLSPKSRRTRRARPCLQQ